MGLLSGEARPSIGPLLPRYGAAGECGPWQRLREEMLRHGSAVCHGYLADWADAAVPGPHGVPGLLGADWDRYRTAVQPAARDRLLGSRLLLNYALGFTGGTAPEQVAVVRGTHGRPEVREPAGFDAGISHTLDLLVIGVARGRRIGVDVESADRQLLRNGLPEKICHPEELAELWALPAAERNRALVRRWTLKEAYAKALGLGLRMDFTRVRFTPGPGAESRDDGSWWCPDAPGWRLHGTTVDGQFLIACAEGPSDDQAAGEAQRDERPPRRAGN